jgi:transposase
LPNLLANTVLIRASFLLEAPMQEMRDPSRCAPEQLVREHASHVQRIQKTLEDANPELASVVTQIMACPAVSFSRMTRISCSL